MSEELLKKEHDFVVPGDKVVSSMEYLPGRNCFRDGDSVFSKRLGIVHVENHVISVVPLSGAYTPQMGDMVIGEVEDIQSNGWFIDINFPASTYLPLSGVSGYVRAGTDLTRIYNIGELIYAKVASCTRQGVNLSMQDMRCRKLIGCKVISIDPVKVPRLIGRAGSMISMIKNKTGCNINVGQNGIVCLQGGLDELATKVIRIIEKDSHQEGLTDKIEKLLNDEIKTSGLVAPALKPEAESIQDEAYGDDDKEGQ